VSQPVVYQAPATIISSQSNLTKKPNPQRFGVNTPTTITPSEPEKPTSSDTNVSTKLRNFIKRSLSSCASQPERDAMQTYLGKLVMKFRNDNKLDSHDWDHEPIPNLSLIAANAAMSLPSPVSSQPTAKGSQAAAATTTETENKKRKSRWDPDDQGNIALTPADSPLKKGKSSVQLPGKPIIYDTTASLTPEESSLRQQRASRFQFDTKSTSFDAGSSNKKNMSYKKKEATIKYRPPASDAYDEFDIESLKIVGTCQVLEKDYFRLTSAPDPSTVRPLDVLKHSLALIKRKWKNSEAEYLYICSQLKAVRQDLTVQNIRNDFMVEVYETHARIALECGDLNEYNQCQTQLKQLYDSGMIGAEMEFTAYRILYYVYLQGNKKYQNGSSDLSGILISLSERAKRHPAVIHALSVRQSIRRENFHRFFQLYKTTPNMGAYILDHMLDGLRLQVLFRMCKAYKPHIPTSWLVEELGFDDTIIGESFLIKAGCVLSEQEESGKIVLTAESVIDPSAVLTQDKLLL
jgi:SAC3 family protein LENG8/THP3